MSGSQRYKRTWLLRELVSASVELPISLCTALTYGTCSDYPSEWLFSYYTRDFNRCHTHGDNHERRR